MEILQSNCWQEVDIYMFKAKHNWTPIQLHRSELLVVKYPEIEQAYELFQGLRKVYQNAKSKGVLLQNLRSGITK